MRDFPTNKMWEEFDEKNLGGKVYKTRFIRYKDYIIKNMFATDCCFHMTIGLSIAFHCHGTSVVEERAQYHMSGYFSLARRTSNILTVVRLCNNMLLMSF